MIIETEDYDIPAIRDLLTAAFTDCRDLRRFCQSHRDFQPVLQLVNERASLQEHVDELIGYCETCLLLDELLAGVKKVNPRQYERFAPYILTAPTESLRDPTLGRRTTQRESGDKSAWRWTLLAASIVTVLGSIVWLIASRDPEALIGVVAAILGVATFFGNINPRVDKIVAIALAIFFIGGLLYVFWPRSNGSSETTPASTPTLTPIATATVQTPTLTASATVQTPTLAAAVTVAIRSTHNRYVTAMDGAWDPPWVLGAETRAIQRCEKFELLCQDDVRAALQTCQKTEAGNRYATAMDGDDDWVIQAETDVLVDCGKFTLVDPESKKPQSCREAIKALKNDGKVRVAFRTCHEKEGKHRLWTAMDGNWYQPLVIRAETTELRASEIFTMTLLP
jgi:hypothetical protein